ncbi:ATP-binding protein [Alloyangia pacifica]|uniref:ATP-binding protein n=1 Tax=Alloyangia pacifica TaxID=311180 RepID=UPI0031D0241E
MTPSIAPLRNVAALVSLVERVQTRTFGLPGMATFYGPSGWGKTTAVTFASNEFQAHCVQVKDCWTPTYLAQAILREIGLPNVRGGVAAMVDAIGAQLARTERPLIIDDAQYLLRKRMGPLRRSAHRRLRLILTGDHFHDHHLYRSCGAPGRVQDRVPARPGRSPHDARSRRDDDQGRKARESSTSCARSIPCRRS